MVITTITMPDYVGAVMAYLRDQPVVTDLCPEASITARMPPYVPNDVGINTIKPKPWVSILAAPGFQHRDLPIMDPQVQIRTYGTTGYNAMKLWRAVHSALMPPGGVNGFTRAGCRVLDISIVNTPMEMIDEGWETRMVLYRLRVLEMEVDA